MSKIKILKLAVLLFMMMVCGCGFSPSGDSLYEGFRNPPASAGPMARWRWDVGGPTEKEVLNRLDVVKKDDFSGVEIYPLENTDGRMLKFTAKAAKKPGLIINLALDTILAAPYLQQSDSSRMITLAKKTLSGPATYATTVDELLRLPDETRPVARPTKRRLMFLRLIPQGLVSFEPGIKPTDKIGPDGSIRFDVPDGNYTFYVGILHENSIRQADSRSNIPVLDVLNKQAVEKYLSGITDKLGPSLGDSVHAVSCDNIDLFGANWTSDFAEQFFHRRGYDVLPYLPVVLDNTLSKERTRFYDTIRRVRYDFCLTFAELFNENFVQTFRGWCKNNSVNCRIGFTDADMLFLLKGVAEANFISPEISLADKRLFAGGNARLSCLFDNSVRSSQIAIVLPIADIWSDCGLYGAGCDDYVWYLSLLRRALNNNGYTADYISEQVLSQAIYDDGKLHFGSQTWDAVMVPDVCSMEFTAAKTLRFFAKSGGKIAFVSGYPVTAPGFKDLLKRTIPVQITISHIEKESRDRAFVFPPPKKDKDNLTSWAAGLAEKLGLSPAVKISPVSGNLLLVHYVTDSCDIFFFTNASRSERLSFNAIFNTGGKTPVIWDIETGGRSRFPYNERADELDIVLEPAGSLLLVFEPDTENLP